MGRPTRTAAAACVVLTLALLVCSHGGAAINWEDAACMAVTGNGTEPVVDGAPEQVHTTFGKNDSSYVVNWISQLTFKNFAGFGNAPRHAPSHAPSHAPALPHGDTDTPSPLGPRPAFG